LVGMWQVSSSKWGQYDRTKCVDQMVEYAKKGFNTFDMADIYGPAEELYGAFRKRWEELYSEEPKTFAFTKWVPPQPEPTNGSLGDWVKKSLDNSRKRLGVKTLDMLQFHWWWYEHPGYMPVLKEVQNLQNQNVVKCVSLTNFDSAHVEEIVLGLKGASPVPIITNQIQFSIVDNRPEFKMREVCQKYGVKLLTYGTFCGGLMSEKWIGQAPKATTPSQGKYLGTINQWGGWDLFQKLLVVLDGIAKKHKVSIANVAARYVLDKDYVAGVIVGARLGLSEHVDENLRVFEFSLDNDDYEAIKGIQKQSKPLMSVIGDCGDEYR